MIQASDDPALAFREDVRLKPGPDRTKLISPVGSFSLRGLTPDVLGVLQQLATRPARLSVLLDRLTPGERAQVRRILDRVGNLLARCVISGERELVRIEATGYQAAYEAARVPADVVVKLSKFAFCRSHAEALVLESPLTPHRAVLVDPAARAVVASLGGACRVADLGGDLPAAAVLELLAHLVGAGFVETGSADNDDGTVDFASDQDPILRQWEFHDLLFHSRSRSGRFDQPFGGVFPYIGEIEPQPAVKRPPSGMSVDLYRPAWDDLMANDPPLTAVLEGRTSVRKYGEAPLTLRQLGEFLYRVARVRAAWGPQEGAPYEASTRPYPCGGAAYELELYLTVRRCGGLAAGIYSYDPDGHRLVLVNEDENDRKAMLHVAWIASAQQANPDVLITITSRFQRLSWKYRAIAYAVTLKHAGVLYQTMYLVATAMGLAPCGLGSGNSDLAARVLCLDYLRESSVGDFIIGSRPTGSTAQAEPGPIPPGYRPVNDPRWRQQAQVALEQFHAQG